MIVAAYFFTDEGESLHGPYMSQEDAEFASSVYAKYMATGKMPREQRDEFYKLRIRSSDFITHVKAACI